MTWDPEEGNHESDGMVERIQRGKGVSHPLT